MYTVTDVGGHGLCPRTHASAINLLTGEVKRMRFGPGTEAPVAWLSELPVRCMRPMKLARRGSGFTLRSCGWT